MANGPGAKDLRAALARMPQPRLVVSVVYPSGRRQDVPAARPATGISGPINRFAPLAPADEDGDDDDEPAAAGGPDGAAQGAAAGPDGDAQGAEAGVDGAGQGGAAAEAALAA